MENSAVQWLVEQLDNTTIFSKYVFLEIIEQAKKMEDKQKEKSFVEGYKTRALASNLIFDEKSEYYAKKLFNKTFKSE